MSLNTKDYFVKQISHLSNCVAIVASAWCQFADYTNFDSVRFLESVFQYNDWYLNIWWIVSMSKVSNCV